MTQNLPLPDLSPDKSEYKSLYEWQVEHHTSLTDFRRTLLNFSREALIQALSHINAYVRFEPDVCIKPVLIAAPITDIIQPVSNHIRFWQKLHTHIPSPFSRLYLDYSKIADFSSFWENSNNLLSVSLSVWIEILERKLSIYEICYQLKIEPHVLSLWLHPLIENKTLEVLTSAVNSAIAFQQPTGPLIACIDDSNTVQRQVKMVLEMSGFRVIGITDPTSCLTLLVRQNQH